MIDLDRLLELEAKATPGPWKWHPSEGGDYEMLCGPFENAEDEEFALISKNFVMDDGSSCGEYARDVGSDTSDGQLIVAMRNSIRELCTELKAAREVVGAVSWYSELEDRYHGEDCGYWDWEEEKPGDEPCVCGVNDTIEALKKYDEATK